MSTLKECQPLIDLIDQMEQERAETEKWYRERVMELEEKKKGEDEAKWIVLNALYKELQKKCPHPKERIIHEPGWDYHNNIDDSRDICTLCKGDPSILAITNKPKKVKK